ncbi:MAG: hypothetical protein ACOC22_04670 [bacterium]
MLNIEYDIKLNESGRPYVYLPDDYENKSEHKFFAIEISRYLLQHVMANKSDELNHFTTDKINMCTDILGQISDEIAEILYHEMKNSGDNALLIYKSYHISVDSYDELLELNDDIIFKSKIFEKKNGLKALVNDEEKIYEFNNGDWNEIV